MRVFTLFRSFFLILLLAACGTLHYQSEASMEIRPETSGWRLQQPGGAFHNTNRFSAIYLLPDKSPLELTVFPANTYEEIEEADTLLLFPLNRRVKTKADECKSKSYGYTLIVFNRAPEVAFNNRGVWLVKADGEIIPGLDVGEEANPDGVYRLDDPLTPARRPRQGGESPPGQSFFYFFFPVSCAEYEGALFVVEDLYHKGQKLPPLAVRMKYKDFSKVPARD